jgi:hypothetical protein
MGVNFNYLEIGSTLSNQSNNFNQSTIMPLNVAPQNNVSIINPDDRLLSDIRLLIDQSKSKLLRK